MGLIPHLIQKKIENPLAKKLTKMTSKQARRNSLTKVHVQKCSTPSDDFVRVMREIEDETKPELIQQKSPIVPLMQSVLKKSDKKVFRQKSVSFDEEEKNHAKARA